MKLSELCDGNYFYYEIEDGGKGIVAADSPEEADEVSEWKGVLRKNMNTNALMIMQILIPKMVENL